MLASLLVGLFLATLPAGHEPGLVIRLYEFEGDVAAVPELAADQAPSDVIGVETLDLTDKFGTLTERFVAEIDGVLKTEAKGEYAFRLTCDDGGILWLDTRMVVNHDGLHGPTPKDGTVILPAGDNPLRIRYFQGTGGARLKLEWKPPGAKDFMLVPKTALASEAAKYKVVPGKKKIIPPLRRGRPGDGTPVAGPHPGFKNAGPFSGGEMVFDKLSTQVRTGVSGNHEPAKFTLWMPDLGSLPLHSVNVREGVYADQAIFVAEAGGESRRVFIDSFPTGKSDVKNYEQSAAFRFGPSDGQSLAPTGKPVFEMLAVRLMSNGVEIEFTQPLDAACGWEAASFTIEQWPYMDGAAPRRDGVVYPVKAASLSEDRKRVFVEIEGIKPQHVLYLRLLPPLVSESGELPWSTEAWYAVGALPKDRAGKHRSRPSQPPQNLLTDAEKAAGWKLLFDGKSLAGWHPFKKPGTPIQGWSVDGGCIARTGPGGDIVTDEKYDNFELKIEWRVTPGANSGIFYGVSEEEPNRWVFETGPEMQVLDNAEHVDGRNPLTSAGSNYALIAPPKDVTRPVGFFNEARIVVRGDHVEHWLNGTKLLEYTWGGEEWQRLVKSSKFAGMPRYGTVRKGHIAIQDHGDRVWFRNAKIRPLAAGADSK